eukprot:340606_1
MGNCTTIPVEGGSPPTLTSQDTELLHPYLANDSDSRPTVRVKGEDISSPSKKNKKVKKQQIDLYTKILSDTRGSLEIPEKFVKWFPPRHGHKKIRKLFKWGAELGRGVTGSVFEVEYKGQICAVKQVEKNDQWGKMLFTTEARVLSKLKHNGIIQFIDMFFDERYYYLVLEKADYDLYYVMKEKGKLSERKTKNITYSLLKAIAYMHKKNLAHRDLKPENIVFVAHETNRPRLIDFGDAEMAKKDKTYTEFVGTPPYMSPERLDEHKGWQLKKADVWAVAVIAYEMYCGKRCFEGDTQKQVFGKILRGEWSWPTDRKPSVEMQDFVNKCLQHDAKDRPSAIQSINHSWFDSKRKEENKSNHSNIRPTIAPVAGCNSNTSIASAVTEEEENNQSYVQKIKQPSNDGVIKVKDITKIRPDGLTNIFENLASMVTSNRLQDILIRGYAENLQGADLGPYKDDFDKLDFDKDGYITGHDLINAFTSSSIGPNQAASLASIIISELDYNRVGKVTFRQFLEARIKSEISNRPRDAFNMISSQLVINVGNVVCTNSSPSSESPFMNSTKINQINKDFEPSAASYASICTGTGYKSDKSDTGSDSNGNNDYFITPQSIIEYGNRSHSNIQISQQDLKGIFDKFDSDKDGRLTFRDFVHAMYATRVVDAPVVDDRLHQLPRNKRCHSKTDLWDGRQTHPMLATIESPKNSTPKISIQHSL